MLEDGIPSFPGGRSWKYPGLAAPFQPQEKAMSIRPSIRLSRCFSASLLALCLALAPLGARASEIFVSAAASLTNAFKEVAADFEKAKPGVTVRLNFAASNPLLKQMLEGAPVDVFASADQETMDKADAGKVISTASRADFARNSLTLIVPKGGKAPAAVADLLSLQRIAVGKPESVPAGRYARQSLSAAGLWDKIQPNLIYGASVRQVLDYVARGEVDAGIVYATDAAQQAAKVDVAIVLGDHTPILYPIAVATTGRNPRDAQAFIDFVRSEKGQVILARYGFARP